MFRVVEPEILDQLPASDPRALRSRRDLRRINWWMRNESHVARCIAPIVSRAKSILEIGAGDGSFILKVLQRLGRPSTGALVYLLDIKPVIPDETLAQLAAIGWEPRVITDDLDHWLQHSSEHFDLITTNLFLHHFREDVLRNILETCSRRC